MQVINMDKDELFDAFLDQRPERYDSWPKEKQMKWYAKFEQDFCEGSLAEAEARGDR